MLPINQTIAFGELPDILKISTSIYGSVSEFMLIKIAVLNIQI